jgi:hypothetical protein
VLASIKGEQIFVLGAHQVRAVDRKQWLASADVLIGRIREHLFDPSRETRLHVALKPFVSFDTPGGLQTIAHVLSHDGRELDSDHLAPLGRDPDWRKLGICRERRRRCQAQK